MYRVDRRIRRHKRARRNTLVVVALLCAAAGVYGLMNLRIAPTQDVQNTEGVVTRYDAASAEKVRIDKPLFTLELPAGWKERAPEPSVLPYSTFAFQSSGAPAQLLALYIDAPPTNMAINHAVIVTPQGAGLAHDTVSGNCTTFTDTSRLDRQTGIAPARWQNVDFLCDMGNFNRGVVGTESTEGVNTVTVTGPTTGTHKVFIRYTDSSVSPDYSTLYSIIASLNFK